MGKNNKKNSYSGDVAIKTIKKKSDRPQGENKPYRKDRPAPKHDEFAVALAEEMKLQMQAFIQNPSEEVKNLFDIGARPSATLNGFPEYAIYQLERTARVDRDDRNKFGRQSTALVAIGLKDGLPRFYCTCFITPSGDYNVTIYEQGENGTVYANTLRYDSRYTNKNNKQ